MVLCDPLADLLLIPGDLQVRTGFSKLLEHLVAYLGTALRSLMVSLEGGFGRAATVDHQDFRRGPFSSKRPRMNAFYGGHPIHAATVFLGGSIPWTMPSNLAPSRYPDDCSRIMPLTT